MSKLAAAFLLAMCLRAQSRRVISVIGIRITYWDPDYRLKDVLAVLRAQEKFR